MLEVLTPCKNQGVSALNVASGRLFTLVSVVTPTVGTLLAWRWREFCVIWRTASESPMVRVHFASNWLLCVATTPSFVKSRNAPFRFAKTYDIGWNSNVCNKWVTLFYCVSFILKKVQYLYHWSGTTYQVLRSYQQIVHTSLRLEMIYFCIPYLPFTNEIQGISNLLRF